MVAWANMLGKPLPRAVLTPSLLFPLAASKAQNAKPSPAGLSEGELTHKLWDDNPVRNLCAA